jgi:hypothetical protein
LRITGKLIGRSHESLEAMGSLCKGHLETVTAIPNSIASVGKGRGGFQDRFREGLDAMILDEMYLRDADEAWRRKQERNANGSSGEQPKSEGAAADEAKAEKNKAPSTQAERLIALARDSVELLFHHQDRAYADIRVGQHRETWPVKSKRFRQWLKRLYYAKHNKAPNAEAEKEGLDHIEAAALFDGEERQVELRVASHDGRIYIDLGSADWRAVEIDEDDWRVIDDPPVRFRRPSGMRPLPEPTRGGDIFTLRSFVNVKDDADFVLVVCWLLAAKRMLCHADNPLQLGSTSLATASSFFGAISAA